MYKEGKIQKTSLLSIGNCYQRDTLRYCNGVQIIKHTQQGVLENSNPLENSSVASVMQEYHHLVITGRTS